MSLAQVFMQGLVMLSDIGVGPSIVQNERGDDPAFLSTAWTMQVIRGFVLFACMCILAYPASLMYNEPLLFPILLLIGSTAILTGFQSIGLATASRKLLLGRLTALDLISQLVGITIMIVWAWLHPTIWALVGGGVVSSAVRVVLGHRIFRSPGNRFHFDRDAAHHIFHFGKWIFLATAMTYFGGQGLRLIQGALVPMDVLGVISIAGTMALAMRGLIVKIGNSVLFPAFADLVRKNPEKLRSRLAESRSKLFWVTLPVFLVLIVFAHPIIEFLYDERYVAAGGYLTIMATGAAIMSIRTPFGMVLLSFGDSLGHSIVMTASAVLLVIGTFVGFRVGGVEGMLIATVLVQLLLYPLEAWRLKRVGQWMPFFDISAMLFYAALCMAVMAVGL